MKTLRKQWSQLIADNNDTDEVMFDRKGANSTLRIAVPVADRVHLSNLFDRAKELTCHSKSEKGLSDLEGSQRKRQLLQNHDSGFGPAEARSMQMPFQAFQLRLIWKISRRPMQSQPVKKRLRLVWRAPALPMVTMCVSPRQVTRLRRGYQRRLPKRKLPQPLGARAGLIATLRSQAKCVLRQQLCVACRSSCPTS